MRFLPNLITLVLFLAPLSSEPKPSAAEVAMADSSTEDQSASASHLQDMMMKALQLQMVNNDSKTRSMTNNQMVENPEVNCALFALSVMI